MRVAIKSAALLAATAAAVVITVSPASAGSSGSWPTRFPLPTEPGTLVSQTSTTAVVRSTATVQVVQNQLDNLYVTQMGCTRRLAVNKPRDYLCHNITTGNTDEVVFTFAALDPTASDPARSQSNAYHLGG